MSYLKRSSALVSERSVALPPANVKDRRIAAQDRQPVPVSVGRVTTLIELCLCSVMIQAPLQQS